MIGDVQRLRQIFDHLIDNAIKFTDHGTIRLTSRLVEQTATEVRIEFSVTDTGHGIALETQQLISGLLVQADGSSVRRHGGIGVGLAIVRRLCELLGGRLQIDSQPGVGSTFRFTLPFALPTAVMGISLATLYAPNGLIGQFFTPLGIKIAFTPIGIWLALIVVSLPFIVRAVQPVLAELSTEYEEAAAVLGAGRLKTFLKVILPELYPALLMGSGMMFARATGEYGSVIFIAGNLPMVSEIAPLMIMSHLEEYDYAGAAAIASVMLGVSFVLLLLINQLQAWSWQRLGGSR